MTTLQTSTSTNNTKIYLLSTSTRSHVPEWLLNAKKNKRHLKYDQNYSKRVDLIQDFCFPEASTNIKMSQCGNYIMATGLYKPQVRVYDLNNLTLKYERHTDAETVKFEMLCEEGWKKFVLLQNDRSIEFHTQNGMFYRTRVPHFGRDMRYDQRTCEVVVGCSSNEVYRLNLEQGRFMKPIVTDFVDGVNVCALNQWNGLYAFGGGEGVVEFYDSRSKSRVAKFSPFAQSLEEGDVTALTFLSDQLSYAVGNSSGEVSIFDLRSSDPVIKRRHFSETPIISIHEHSISDNIVSADKKSIRVWNKKTGETFCAYEPEHDLNDLMVVPKSGMIMTANEGTFMNVLFVPSLGPAPKFCTFLDNLTEELEEPSAQAAQAGVFDDYKFVTKKELEQLSLDHFIGTNILRAYMHGFFIDNRLYEKAKILYSFQASGVGLGADWKKEMIKKKMEEEAASRISSGTKLPKVNKSLAKKILDNKAVDEASNVVEDEGANNLVDDRFKDLFKDPLFEIDEDNAEFVKFNTRPKDTKKTKKTSEKEQNADDMQDEAEGVNSSDDDSVFGETVEIQRYGKKADKTKNRKEFSWDNRPRKANKKDNRTFADRIKKHSRPSKNKTSSRSTDGAMSMTFRVKSRK